MHILSQNIFIEVSISEKKRDVNAKNAILAKNDN